GREQAGHVAAEAENLDAGGEAGVLDAPTPGLEFRAAAGDEEIQIPIRTEAEALPGGEGGIEALAAVAERAQKERAPAVERPAQLGAGGGARGRSNQRELLRVAAVVDDAHAFGRQRQLIEQIAPRALGVGDDEAGDAEGAAFVGERAPVLAGLPGLAERAAGKRRCV